jgi:chromosomal replication initiator protein
MNCRKHPELTSTREYPRDIKFVSLEKIKHTIENHFGIPMERLITPCRRREYVYPRHMMMWFLKNYTQLSFKKIGELFGGRDHTTVIHAAWTIDDLIKSYPNVKYEVEEITVNLFL